MFHEDMCEQWFFDKETKCIYLVSNELDDIIIVQIEEDSEKYYKFYNEYLKWKSDNLPLQLFIQECERYIEKCSEDEMTKLYDEMTIDISMLGLTTKLVWGAEEYNRIIDALKILLAEETIE